MGNLATRETNINLENIFQSDIKGSPRSTSVVMVLDPPAVWKREGVIMETERVVITVDDQRLNFGAYDEGEHSDCVEWRPQSHMRDFEVIENDKGVIARGQGIGILIVEYNKAYVKLKYDKYTPLGVKAAVYGLWGHESRAREILESDLSLGYDVLLMSPHGQISLCEKRDERDEKDTLILLSSYQKYATYTHGFVV